LISNNVLLLRVDCVYLYSCELYKVSEKSPTSVLKVEHNYRINIRIGTAYVAILPLNPDWRRVVLP